MTKTLIKNISKNMIDSLLNVSENGFKKEYEFEINCESLKDYNNIDIRESFEFASVFRKLKELNGPVLYWFEILSDIDNENIRKRIRDYSNSNNSKVTPAMKKYYDPKSKCLYVGKVKKAVWGRMIQHLGFYKVQRTQGLQLFYWSKGLNLKLKVHLYEFEQEMADLISIFEIELAKQNKPIVGKHK
jgi:hypothetical protein